MNVQIYSRKEIEVLIAEGKFPQNTAVISFYGSITNPPDLVNYSGVCERVMYIELDDLEFDELEEIGYSYDTFFPEADEAARFIIDINNKAMDIICECEYGQSRSAGCAAAILEDFFHNGISVFADPKYYPNKVVYHKLLDALKAHSGLKKFQIDERGHLLKYNGTDEEIEIPEGVNSIEILAFKGSVVRSVKIPESVRLIADSAFSNCLNLKRINIPSSAEIDILAFQGCKNLEFIDISPDAYIDRNVFYGTKWTRNYPDDFIVVNGVLIEYKGKPRKAVIPDNVREIGAEAFSLSKEIKEIVIPKSVEKIDRYAFGGRKNLEVITIENPDIKIEERAFLDCPNIRRIICGGESVSVEPPRDNARDFTDAVKSIMALVRQKDGHE